MATPRKRIPRPPGFWKEKVLTDEQYQVLLEKIGPQPDVSDDLDQHMLWAAFRAQAHMLNSGTRDSLIIAKDIIKAQKQLDGKKAPPGKTAQEAAKVPPKRIIES